MNQEQSINNRAALASYKQAISRYIRSAMVLRGIQYTDLCVKLENRGISYSSDNLRNKVSRGMFSADLLLAIADALDLGDDMISSMLKQKEKITPPASGANNDA